MKSSNPYRILYAEKNEDARQLVSFICQLSGIEIITAETTAEAWELAQAEHFDLYLLDTRYPDGHGLNLCCLLRSFAPYVPIIFYSGDAFESDRQKALAAGANDYLTKPYAGELAETIRKNIEQTEKAFNQTETSHS